MTDSQKAAQEIYNKILAQLLVSEPPDDWLRLTRDQVEEQVRQIIDKHLC